MIEAPVNGGRNYNGPKVGSCLSKIWLYAGKSEYPLVLAVHRMEYKRGKHKNKYLLLIRGNYPDEAMSPGKREAVMKEWDEWFGKISATNNVADPGSPISNSGKIVSKDGVTDGPIKSDNQWVGGYVVLQAANTEEAIRLSQSCPALEDSVIEVREMIEFT